MFEIKEMMKMTCCSKREWLDSCATLEILLDLGGVLAVKAFDLAIKSHVPIVDEVHIGSSLFGTSSTVAASLFHSFTGREKETLLITMNFPLIYSRK